MYWVTGFSRWRVADRDWHCFPLLLLNRPVLVLDLLSYRVYDLGSVSKSFIQSCKHPEAFRLEI